ncbi:unnamed protein product [Pleuronectes platessa]|uniref:Uncharacterized protein n=1 Tax=Pleuronectes platessa TaxID=8262 RepID=A0A9N7ULI3_PLEPL|nr:unnamed protein product [Pleuronectes platessa]
MGPASTVSRSFEAGHLEDGINTYKIVRAVSAPHFLTHEQYPFNRRSNSEKYTFYTSTQATPCQSSPIRDASGSLFTLQLLFTLREPGKGKHQTGRKHRTHLLLTITPSATLRRVSLGLLLTRGTEEPLETGPSSPTHNAHLQHRYQDQRDPSTTQRRSSTPQLFSPWRKRSECNVICAEDLQNIHSILQQHHKQPVVNMATRNERQNRRQPTEHGSTPSWPIPPPLHAVREATRQRSKHTFGCAHGTAAWEAGFNTSLASDLPDRPHITPTELPQHAACNGPHGMPLMRAPLTPKVALWRQQIVICH